MKLDVIHQALSQLAVLVLDLEGINMIVDLLCMEYMSIATGFMSDWRDRREDTMLMRTMP